jgi:hypothetical protein
MCVNVRYKQIIAGFLLQTSYPGWRRDGWMWWPRQVRRGQVRRGRDVLVQVVDRIESALQSTLDPRPDSDSHSCHRHRQSPPLAAGPLNLHKPK